MANLADLTVRVVSDVKGVQVGMAKTRAELQKTQKEAEKTGKSFNMQHAAIAAGALAVAGAVGVFAVKSVGVYKDWGSQLRTIQRLTGATAEQSGNLFAAMKLTVGPQADIASGLAFYAKNLGLAHKGTGTQADDFKRLGIAMKDSSGQWRTGADILPELRDKLAALADPSERARIAAELLGRGYKTLLPYLTASTQTMADNQKFLNSLGFGVSKKDMADFMEFAGDEKKMAFAMQYMQFQMGKLIAQLENKVMPTVLKFMGVVNRVPSGIWVVVGAVAGLIGVWKAGQVAMEVFNGARGLLGMTKRLSGVSSAIPRFVQGFKDARVASSMFSGVAGTLGGKVRSIATAIGANVKAFVGYIAKVPGIIAANAALALSYTAVAAAAAAAGLAIYEAIKAYQSWQSAIDQANAAQNGANANNEAAYQSGRITKAQYEQNKAAIAQDSYKAPWYMKNPLDALQVPGFSSGGVAKAPASGGLAMLHGVEKITPVDKERPPVVVNVNWSSIARPSRDEVRRLADMLNKELGLKAYRAQVGLC
jgi:hypothetical protein